MLRSTIKTILKGLVVILPIVVVGLALFWLIASLEAGLGTLARAILGETYFPGAGIALALALSYAVGLSMTSRAAQRLFDRWERLLRRIPLVKTIYGSIQDMASLLSAEKRQKFNRVVLVTIGDTGIKLVGFVTREDMTAIDPAGADTIAVYLPMSYQIGGYLAVVPRASISPVEMSVEDASRLVFTAAVSMGGRPTPPVQ